MSQPQFEIYRDNAGKYRWRLRAANGEIIAASEAYESRDGAAKGIQSVRKAAPQAVIEDLLGATTFPAFTTKTRTIRPSKPPSGRPSNTVIALTVLFVLSALTFGYSLGNFVPFWPLSPVTIRLTETRAVTVTTEIRVTTCTTTTTPPEKPKWIDPPPAPLISYLDAGKYIGQTKTVEGKIVKTNRYEPGNVIFLNFHDPYQGYFTVIIWRENWKNFPSGPEVFYNGKEVRVTGLIKDYQGAPEIEATNQKQIEVAYMGFNYPTSAATAFCVPAPIIRNTEP